MGYVHPLLVVGMVGGRRRPLAALHLKSADPGWDMVQVTSRILSYLKSSQRYINLELAWAETVPDGVWSRDVEDEYWLRKEELEELEDLPGGCSESRVQELQAEIDRLDRENLATYVPEFPVVHTCLLLGAISSDWNTTFLHRVGNRPWNSAPDWGGKRMWQPGCTVIDLTDRSYAFVLPAEKTSDWGDDQPYLALQPISGRQWLRAFGLHSKDPASDEVWICGGETASIMSKQALQEVWPSFLRDDKNNKDSKDEDATIDCNEAGDDGDEEKNRDGEVEQEAPASRTRKTEPEPSDERVAGTIDQLLDFCPQKRLLVLEATKEFLPQLERYTREHPEQFAAEHPGTVPLLLAVVTQGQEYIAHLELNRFKALSGGQVFELVEAVVAKNAEVLRGERRPLELLDLSFNASVTTDDLARILNVTDVKELLIWDNPRLPLEEVAKVADGRIAKVTTRAGFLAPLEKWVKQCWRNFQAPVRVQPAPPTAPTRTRIRQVVWMMLVTEKVDVSKPPAAMDGRPRVPLGTLSLEDFDAETLATLLHPMRHRMTYFRSDPNRIFAELVAFPQHDAWTPLAELYTSLASIEKFMSHKSIIDESSDILTDRWPLIFPLMMATGSIKSEWAVSSPFPAEAFHLAMWEAQSQSFKKPTRICGPEPIVHGEHTLVFLREPDLGRLRLGLVTRDAAGQLEVHDPAAAARAAGDDEAGEAWERGVGTLPAWTGKGEEQDRRYRRNTMLLDAAAVNTMWAAAAELAVGEDEMMQKILDTMKERRQHSQRD